jgi:hypothetical protein
VGFKYNIPTSEGELRHYATNRKVVGSIPDEVTFFLALPNLSTASVVYWSEFLATEPEVWVRFPALREKKIVGLERGPLSLVSTTEELLDRKVAAPV